MPSPGHKLRRETENVKPPSNLISFGTPFQRRNDKLEQGLETTVPESNPACRLLLSVKFYWNMAAPTRLHTRGCLVEELKQRPYGLQSGK